jgi:hypothetical protein
MMRDFRFSIADFRLAEGIIRISSKQVRFAAPAIKNPKSKIENCTGGDSWRTAP